MRRFVTYIYEYEGGIRGRNVGFVRTDLREDGCRMELQIRGFDRFNGKCPVYLTVNDSQPLGIPVAELLLSQGMGSCRIFCAGNRIGKSNTSIRQTQTLNIACGNNRQLIGILCSCTPAPEFLNGTFTIFDNTPAKPYDNDLQTQTDSESVPASMLDSASVHSFPPQSASVSAPVFPQSNSTPTDTMSSQIPAASDSIHAPTPDSVTDFESAHATNPASKPESMTVSVSTSTYPAESKPMPVPDSVTLRSLAPATDFESAHTAFPAPSPESTSSHSSTPMPDSVSPRDSMPAQNSTPQAQEHAQPVVFYKKIEITDIRRLPKSNWNLCSNRFLIHGFFNYRYLMLKTVEQDKEKKLYLGVPGIYEQPERMMALLFGFPEFEAAKRQTMNKAEQTMSSLEQTINPAGQTMSSPEQTITPTRQTAASQKHTMNPTGQTAASPEQTTSSQKHTVNPTAQTTPPPTKNMTGTFGYWMCPLN